MSSRSPKRDRCCSLVPATAGIGLRAPHHAELEERRPQVGWLEAHSENYFGRGSGARASLLRLRDHYPLSLHGVGLSLGSWTDLDLRHLDELDALVRDLEPGLVSEHVSWGAAAGRHLNDLLPLPWSREARDHLVARVQLVQERLGRQILLENVSSYLSFAGGEMPEWQFLAELSRTSGCGLLLDVNNVFVSSHNLGFDPLEFLRSLPISSVQEIHLAGHSIESHGARIMRVDTHSALVCDEVWRLFAIAVERFGPVPTLIEWDAEIPPLDVLLAEAKRAAHVMEGNRHAFAA
jgi:uncharacterized protein